MRKNEQVLWSMVFTPEWSCDFLRALAFEA